MEAERQKLRAARRLVVKVGTATVTGADGELCARARRADRALDCGVDEGRPAGRAGFVGRRGLGRGWLGLHRSRLDDLVTKQACAAVGQSLLMDAYKNLFAQWEIKVAQVLLTEEDFTNWRRYSNLRRHDGKADRIRRAADRQRERHGFDRGARIRRRRLARGCFQRQRSPGRAGDERARRPMRWCC